MALRNVDRIIKDNQVAVKDTLRNFETFTATLAGNGERITDIVDAADDVLKGIDGGLAKTDKFLASLGSAKYGGDLLPTMISLRELIQSFDKRSGILMADTRRMLQDVSQSISKADQKLGGRPPPDGRCRSPAAELDPHAALSHHDSQDLKEGSPTCTISRHHDIPRRRP